jgi:hypothetical protein
MKSKLDTQHDEGNSVPMHYNTRYELHNQLLNTEIQNNKPMLLSFYLVTLFISTHFCTLNSCKKKIYLQSS